MVKCSPDDCQYYKLTESVISDMKVAIDKLAEGQGVMRDTLIQLTEAFKMMDRIEKRVEKVEATHKEDLKAQDVSIRELEKVYWKAAGGLAAIGVVVQVLLKLLVG